MATKADITPELLRQLLRYEARDGSLYWKPRLPCHFCGGAKTPEHQAAAWNGKWAYKKAAGQINNSGYQLLTIYNFKFLAHRVVWALHYNEWPHGEIDHINRTKFDNRIENLRVVTRSKNNLNQGVGRRNKSGSRGVSFNKKRSLWAAQICFNGKSRWLGYHRTLGEAIEARRLGEKKLLADITNISPPILPPL